MTEPSTAATTPAPASGGDRIERGSVGLLTLGAVVTAFVAAGAYVLPPLFANADSHARIAAVETNLSAYAAEVPLLRQRIAELESGRAADRAETTRDRDRVGVALDGIRSLLLVVCTRLPTRPGEPPISCR